MQIWREAKRALTESIYLLRQEALCFMADERRRILNLSKEETIREALKAAKIDRKIRAIESVTGNGLLEV